MIGLKKFFWRYKMKNASELVIYSLPMALPLLDIGWRDPPQAMPNIFKENDVVEAYRRFYREDKSRFARWTKRPTPLFMQE